MTDLTHLDRDTLIRLEREMRGKPGVGVIRAHLRKQVHEALARAPNWIVGFDPASGPDVSVATLGHYDGQTMRYTEVELPLVLLPEWRVA